MPSVPQGVTLPSILQALNLATCLAADLRFSQSLRDVAKPELGGGHALEPRGKVSSRAWRCHAAQHANTDLATDFSGECCHQCLQGFARCYAACRPQPVVLAASPARGCNCELPISLRPLALVYASTRACKMLRCEQPAAIDFWQMLQPELARCLVAEQPTAIVFGGCFDLSLQGVALSSSLRPSTFGECLEQNLQGMKLEGSLQSLTFGTSLNQ